MLTFPLPLTQKCRREVTYTLRFTQNVQPFARDGCDVLIKALSRVPRISLSLRLILLRRREKNAENLREHKTKRKTLQYRVL